MKSRGDHNAEKQVITKLPHEKNKGNREYKLKISLGEESTERKRLRLEQLKTQLLYRLNEGEGEAIYTIGVADDGDVIGLSQHEMDDTLETLREIAEELNTEITLIRTAAGAEGQIAEVLIRRVPGDKLPISLRIAVIGNVDAGKSTMLGCLITGQLDDGDGKSRQVIFRHPHELNSGRTSSVSMKILGFNEKGKITNYREGEFPSRSQVELISDSSKLIRFIDLAGHEKYLKTTMFGITGQSPDYSCILLAANSGILPMTREHLGLSIVMKIPFFFVISKIDLTPAPVLKSTISSLKKLLKSTGLSRLPLIVKDINDVVIATSMIRDNRVTPVFKCSFVTGQGMDLLTSFLNLLPVRYSWSENKEQDFLMYIDSIFNVPGVGTVVAGLVQRGKLARNDRVLLGPDDNGRFHSTRIRSIEHRRIPVTSVVPGQYVTFALALDKMIKVRKGQVLTAEENPRASWGFKADILLLHHATTVKQGYNAHLHFWSVRQTAHLLELDKKYVRTGDRATCQFRFMFRPEYLIKDGQFLFREGRTRGMGIIKELIP
ncbi:MAG: GTP-binding protein [Candidatus Hodarchaeales archaeon]